MSFLDESNNQTIRFNMIPENSNYTASRLPVGEDCGAVPLEELTHNWPQLFKYIFLARGRAEDVVKFEL